MNCLQYLGTSNWIEKKDYFLCLLNNLAINSAPYLPNSFWDIFKSFNEPGKESINIDNECSLKWLFDKMIDLTFLHFLDFNNYDNNGKYLELTFKSLKFISFYSIKQFDRSILFGNRF